MNIFNASFSCYFLLLNMEERLTAYLNVSSNYYWLVLMYFYNGQMKRGQKRNKWEWKRGLSKR